MEVGSPRGRKLYYVHLVESKSMEYPVALLFCNTGATVCFSVIKPLSYFQSLGECLFR